MTRMSRAVVPLLALSLLAACSSAGGPARPRPHWASQPLPGPTAESHTVTGPRDGADAASFEVASGVTAVTVGVADLGDDLYRVRTPDDARVAPLIRADGTDLRLFTRGTGRPGPADVSVTLNRSVRWHLRFAGGAQDQEVNLADGAVSAVDFVSGASRIALTLPKPQGTVPVRMTGGAGEFLIHLPAGVPARVQVSGGAGNATVDGETRGGVGGDTIFEPADWAAARDRYQIDVVAGVSSLVVDRG